MNNYHRHKGLSGKVRAIKRNEEAASIRNNNTTNESSIENQTVPKKLRRLFLRAQGDLIHLQDTDPQTFNELFNFYRNEVYNVQKDIDKENDDWSLLKNLTTNKYFSDDIPVLSKQDFYERVNNLCNLIDSYID
ncbi:hypothetical protein [Sporosarcina cascadiensis]|uniref:hypothetical protein n=1 Tax=Sporosarcina cascadiensis TaxID=2660747 RepID=UPI00129AF754|nr:hypothetical protein [Sporosarcina cascadiensis]